MELKIITNDGAARVTNSLNRYAHRGAETGPVMDEIALDMIRVEGMIFKSNGRRGGGAWRNLKPDTIRKKGTTQILRTAGARQGYSSPGNDALFRSLTVLGAPGQILEITRRRVEFGTSVESASVHQRGAPSVGIPARPILRFLPSDIARWNRMIAEHLLEIR